MENLFLQLAQRPGVDVGIWIEQMTTDAGMGSSAGGTPGTPTQSKVPSIGIVGRPTPTPTPAMGVGMGMGGGAQPSAENANTITLVCRAVNLTKVDPSANSVIAYAVESEIKNCPLVDPKSTQLTGQMATDEASGTFTFTVNVALLNPMKF